MIPLSKATVQMSKYVRDDQKQEWYDNEPIYIYCINYKIADEIRDECKRRKIKHEYFPNVVEYRPRRSLTEAYVQSEDMCKIEIRETGLKVRQLADWAITKFNNESTDLSLYNVLSYCVWIQPQREVSVGNGSYDDDGLPNVYAEHWRV